MTRNPDEEIVEMLRAVDVPEPSPLFWDHLSQRVREAVAVEPVPGPHWMSRFHLAWAAGICAAVAIVALAVVMAPRQGDGSGAPQAATQAAMPAVDAVAATLPRLPPIEDDASLVVMGELASQMDTDEAGEAGLIATPGSAEGALSQLSAEEQRAVVELLRQEIGNPSSL